MTVRRRAWRVARGRDAARGFRAVCVVFAMAAASLAMAAAPNPFAQYSDQQLTRLASDWQALSPEERRDFFLEVRRRMVANGRKQAIPVEVQRRFGRTVRRPDGSVVRIEQVVRYRSRASNVPAPEEERPDDYGKGFERRVEQAAEPERRLRVPVVTVKKTVDSD